MNLVDQWFPRKVSNDDALVDNICLVMHYFRMSKKEFDELYIPQYIVLRNYAIKKLNEEQEQINKMFGKKPNIRGR